MGWVEASLGTSIEEQAFCQLSGYQAWEHFILNLRRIGMVFPFVVTVVVSGDVWLIGRRQRMTTVQALHHVHNLQCTQSYWIAESRHLHYRH